MKALRRCLRWLLLMVVIPVGGCFVLAVVLADHLTALLIVGSAWFFTYSIVANSLASRGRGVNIDYGEYSILIWRVRKTRSGKAGLLLGWARSLAWLFLAPVVGVLSLARGIRGEALPLFSDIPGTPMFEVTFGTVILVASAWIWTIHALYLSRNRE